MSRGGPSRGITLVELTVAMVILSAVASIGAQSFILVLRADQEMESRSTALRAAQSTLDELRRDLGSLVPSKVAGHEPFSAGMDAGTGGETYRLVTRLPEGFAREAAAGQAQAMRVEYFLAPQEDDGFRLVCRRQALGLGGLLGEPLEGTLAAHLAQFQLTAAGGDGTAPEDGGATVPSAVDVTLQFALSDVSQTFSIRLPVGVEADKKEGGAESQNPGAPEEAADPKPQS